MREEKKYRFSGRQKPEKKAVKWRQKSVNGEKIELAGGKSRRKRTDKKEAKVSEWRKDRV